jgi:hypothetical protein
LTIAEMPTHTHGISSDDNDTEAGSGDREAQAHNNIQSAPTGGSGGHRHGGAVGTGNVGSQSAGNTNSKDPGDTNPQGTGWTGYNGTQNTGYDGTGVTGGASVAYTVGDGAHNHNINVGSSWRPKGAVGILATKD